MVEFGLVGLLAAWLNMAPNPAIAWGAIFGGVVLLYGCICALISAGRLWLIRRGLARTMSNARRNLRGLAMSERMRFRALYSFVMVCATLLTLGALHLYGQLSIAVFVTGFAIWFCWHGLANLPRIVAHDRAVATAYTPRLAPRIWPVSLTSRPLDHGAQVTAALSSIYHQTGQDQGGRDALAILYDPSAYFPKIQHLRGRSLPMTAAWLSHALAAMAPAAALAGLIAVLLFASTPRHYLPRLPPPAAVWDQLTMPDDEPNDVEEQPSEAESQTHDDQSQNEDSHSENDGNNAEPLANEDESPDNSQQSGGDEGAGSDASGDSNQQGSAQSGNGAQQLSAGSGQSGAGAAEASTAAEAEAEAGASQTGAQGGTQIMAEAVGADRARPTAANSDDSGPELGDGSTSTAQTGAAPAPASPDTPNAGGLDQGSAEAPPPNTPGQNGTGQDIAATPPSTDQREFGPVPESGANTNLSAAPSAEQGGAAQPDLGESQQLPTSPTNVAPSSGLQTPADSAQLQDQPFAAGTAPPTLMSNEGRFNDQPPSAEGDPAQGQQGDDAQRDALSPDQNQPPSTEMRAPNALGTSQSRGTPRTGSADAPHPFSTAAQRPEMLEFTLSVLEDIPRVTQPLPPSSPALPGWIINLLTP